MRLKFSRPWLNEERRQLLAFLLGREYAEPGPDPQVPANYRPYEPRHGVATAPPSRYTQAPTKTPLDIAVARKLLVGRVRSAAERRAHPTAASGLRPAAHTPPPTALLGAPVDELFPPAPLPAPPRIPHFDDLRSAQFAPGRRRAPLPWALESPTLAAMLPAAPARHALTGGEK